ncbi:hypothetical protein FX988_04282 (plasmid) [Paraglaciecola mesophila]|uniref:HNH domain-containing protein n=1 Tax=Paraglaciecola mesophila TaxID=197222 RepID=A0A857JS05_9ALTE|nr:HNH endonuclease [Paraglaciecola mesophila]QHJ14000.1 hypothetical protein FX988_04282 [Paraglaciecola mesophila]
MIKLEKYPKPEVLVANEVTWTEEFIRLVAGDTSVPKAARYRYRHPDIKSTLRSECSDKCIFCESKISHVFPGETDHIIPLSRKQEDVVKWENLGYVCKECNRNKSNYHDVNLPLVNPFVDDPDEHLLFFGPIILAKPSNNRGQITVDLLKLSRSALVERKKERIDQVKLLIDRIGCFPDGEAQDFLKNQVLEEAGGSKEYSATISAYLNAVFT